MEYYVSQTLRGEYIGIKESESGELDVRYGSVYLRKLKDGNPRIEKPKLERESVIRRS